MASPAEARVTEFCHFSSFAPRVQLGGGTQICVVRVLLLLSGMLRHLLQGALIGVNVYSDTIQNFRLLATTVHLPTRLSLSCGIYSRNGIPHMSSQSTAHGRQRRERGEESIVVKGESLRISGLFWTTETSILANQLVRRVTGIDSLNGEEHDRNPQTSQPDFFDNTLHHNHFVTRDAQRTQRLALVSVHFCRTTACVEVRRS